MSMIRYCGCPKCKAIFKLSATASSTEVSAVLADEMVRCGACQAVFDVNINLMQETDNGFAAIRPERAFNQNISPQSRGNADGTVNRKQDKHVANAPPVALNVEDATNARKPMRIDETENPFADRVPHSLNIHQGFDFIDEDMNVEALTSSPFLPERRGLEAETRSSLTDNKVHQYIAERTNPLVTFIWFVVVAGFVVLLGMQIKHSFVEKYAQDARYRQYLAGFCRIAGCQLPIRQDPFQFTLTHTRINLHPTEPGALRVTVKAVNQAQFAQPYPHLQLTLTDRLGRVVGRRTFPPKLYLPKTVNNMIEQGQLAEIVLNLARPHEKAVGFIVDIVMAPLSS